MVGYEKASTFGTDTRCPRLLVEEHDSTLVRLSDSHQQFQILFGVRQANQNDTGGKREAFLPRFPHQPLIVLPIERPELILSRKQKRALSSFGPKRSVKK